MKYGGVSFEESQGEIILRGLDRQNTLHDFNYKKVK
jgi:hypothetical protein